MVRATRLMELSDRLHADMDLSVAALARDFGVSIRTLRRDIATLRDVGLPVTGQTGPGGGIRLEGSRGVTAVHLTLPEVMALWLASRLARQSSVLPWSESATSALQKLLASVPKQQADSLRAILRRVFVGGPASAALASTAGRTPANLLTLFEEAFTSGTGLGFDYTDGKGARSSRRIEPHGLLVEPPVWYMLSVDVEKQAMRTFRMDRVDRPRSLPNIRFRPDLRTALAQLPTTGSLVRADTGRLVARA